MNWIESSNAGQSVGSVDAERAKVLDLAREEKLPVIEKEAATGVKSLDPLKFQPVHSPGIYEAEFAMKGDDIIFHFWPWGYHKSDRNGEKTPRLSRNFPAVLSQVFTNLFGSGRFDIENDEDMGAHYVRCIGWGSNQFARDLAIKACKGLHSALGGVDG